MLSCKFSAYFQNIVSLEQLRRAASYIRFNEVSGSANNHGNYNIVLC